MTVADSAEKWGPHFCLSIVLRIHQYGIEHFGLISDNSNNGSPHLVRYGRRLVLRFAFNCGIRD
jgi:hypothetical protein